MGNTVVVTQQEVELCGGKLPRQKPQAESYIVSDLFSRFQEQKKPNSQV